MGKGDQSHKKRKAIPRTPSGRPSRSKTANEARKHIAFEEGPMQTVLKARRLHRKDFEEPDDAQTFREKHARPVTKAQATEQQLDVRGSVLGRLRADGRITPQEFTAGEDYCARYIEYATLNGLPRPTPQGASYGEVRGGIGPDRIRKAINAREQHMADIAVLRPHGHTVMWAIKRACVVDEAAPFHAVKAGLAALVAKGR